MTSRETCSIKITWGKSWRGEIQMKSENNS